MKYLALIAGILAALAVCGCVSSQPYGPGVGVGANITLPGLPPTRPVCIPKDACVATYGDGWKVHSPCGEQAQAQRQVMMVPMYVDTFNRMFTQQPREQEAEDGREVLSRTVTTVFKEHAPAGPVAVDADATP